MLVFVHERQGSCNYILYGTTNNCGCSRRKYFATKNILKLLQWNHTNQLVALATNGNNSNDGLLPWIDNPFET